MDQLVQLQMNRSVVTVLRILDQEDHQKCDDRCTGINNQLPRIRVVEDGSGDSPSHDDADGSGKGPPGAQIVRASASKPGEPVRTGHRFFRYFYCNCGRFHRALRAVACPAANLRSATRLAISASLASGSGMRRTAEG